MCGNGVLFSLTNYEDSFIKSLILETSPTQKNNRADDEDLKIILKGGKWKKYPLDYEPL